MKGYRTIVIALVQLVLYIVAYPQITELIPGRVVAIVSALLMLALRFITDTPPLTGSRGAK